MEDATRGRRGNGLQSADWGALVDLDPRLSEALLASLASAGVAAYVEPALGSNTFTRAATLPDRPLDRLWVDPARADSAREVVGAEVADLTTLLAEQEPGATAHGLVQPVPRTAARRVLTPPVLPGRPVTGPPPGPTAPPAPSAGSFGPPAGQFGPVTPPSPPDATPTAPPTAAPASSSPSGPVDPDEEFRRIVEGFSRDGDSPVPPWPVSEDVDRPGRRLLPGRPERSGEDQAARQRRRNDPSTEQGPAEQGLPGWVEPAPVEDEGHYEPPPPPPVPRLSPQKLAAAAALVVGFLLMFAPKLLLQDRTAFVGMMGLLLTAGGAAAMVYLVRDAPPTDSGPDDGAVV